jgi:hypothetical protein
MDARQGTINMLHHLSPRKDLQIKKPLFGKPHQESPRPALLLPTQISMPTSELVTKESVTPMPVGRKDKLTINGYSPMRQQATMMKRDSKMSHFSGADDPYSILPTEYMLQLQRLD